MTSDREPGEARRALPGSQAPVGGGEAREGRRPAGGPARRGRRPGPLPL